MKTIAVNQRGGLLRGLFVLAALGGLYYYKKQGGSFTSLIKAGTDGLGSARSFINNAAPSVPVSTTV